MNLSILNKSRPILRRRDGRREAIAIGGGVAAAGTTLLLTAWLGSVFVSQALASEWPAWRVASVAHRGGIVAGVPENTLAAFRGAIDQDVNAIEIDLQGTVDGEVVIMHDETVDRTTNGHRKVAELTLAELKLLDAGGGERIPTYEEALQLVAGTGVTLVLDIKQSPVLDKAKVVRLTEQHNAVLNVIVGPRSIEDLRSFRALNPNLRTLGFIPNVEDVDLFVSAGADIIRLWPEWIVEDPDLVKKLHQLGKPVWTTAGSAPRSELEQLIQLGVNGILSDSPSLMKSVLADMDQNRSR
jgi:glycerophosphoryl diester phosphodiesterase